MLLTMKSGCSGSQCGACAPAIDVTVTAAGGGPVADATITGGACVAETVSTRCEIQNASPETFEVTLAAPGYQAMHLTFTIEDNRGPTTCYACGYVPQTATATLSLL